jgi:hypothetical protein
MCIRSIVCEGCGKGVTEGHLYQCTELHDITFMEVIMYGICACGALHPYVLLAGHVHMYCPECFVPLGDPEAEIKETAEPKLVAPEKPMTVEEFAKRFINV